MVSRLDEIRRKKREEHRKKREEERRLQEEQRKAQEANQPFVPVSNNDNDGYSRVYGEFGWKWIKVSTDANDISGPTKSAVETRQGMNGEFSRPPAARRSLDSEFRSSNGPRASANDSIQSTRPPGPVSYVSKTAGASPLSDVTCSQPSPSKAPTKRGVSFTKPETVNENEPEDDPVMAIMRKLEAEKKNKQKVEEYSSRASQPSPAKNDPIEIQRRLSKETKMTDPLEIARVNEEKKRAKEKEREMETESEEEEKKSGNDSPKNPLALMERNNRERRSLSPEAAEHKSRPHIVPTADLWDDSEVKVSNVVAKKKPTARKKSGETRNAPPTKKVGRKQESDDDDDDSDDDTPGSGSEKEETLIPSFAHPKLGPPAALEPLELPRSKDQTGSHMIPASINRYLRGYQQHGISFLYSCIVRDSGAILGDDMGLGKTVQLISLLASLFGKTGTGKDATELHRRRRLISKKLREIKAANDEALMFSGAPLASSDTREIEGLCLPEWAPVLVIVPPSVIDNWMKEFRTWGHFAVEAYQGKGKEQAIEKVKNGTNEVLVCGSSLATNHCEAMAEVPWKLIIVDEIHNYKNAASKAYQKLRELRDSCQCPILGMTGTIMPNHHKELYNLIDLVSPGLLGDWKTFRVRFSGPIKYARIKSADAETIQQSLSCHHELDALLKKVYLTRTKEDELGDELPEKDETVLFCEPTEIQKTLYKHVLTLPDYELLRYGNAPCDCGVNRGIFEGYKRLRTRKEKVEFQRRHKDDIKRRKECCFETPRNPNRESDEEPLILPDAVLWRFQHEEDEQCDNCPYCVQFPAYNKLYKLSSHAALLLAERDPSSLVEGSQSWRDAAKDLAFARVAIPPDLLLELPGGESNPYVIQDGIMNDHAKLSGKMDKIDKLLRVFDRGENRILLFSHYIKTLDLIQQFVQSRGYSFLRLDGQTSTPERQKLVDQFQSDPTIFLFLMSTKAGGLGLNLTAANKVICFDLDFNPSYDEQAQDRAFRIGQTKDVQVIRLISQGTIEEQKYIRQIYKVHLKNDTIKSVQEDGTGQARLFRGVQGDKNRKGEIFGVENLLKFKDGSFMSDLWKSSENRPSRKDDTVKVDDLTNALTNLSEQQVDNIGGNLLEQDFDFVARAQVGDEDEEDFSKAVEGTTAINHQELFAPHQEDSDDDDREEVLGGASQNMMAVLDGDDDDDDGDDEQRMPAEPPARDARDIRADLEDDRSIESDLPKKRRAVAPLESIDEGGPAHVQFAAAVESFPDEEDDFLEALEERPPKKPKKAAQASNAKKRSAKATGKEIATTFSTSDIALPEYSKSKKKKKKRLNK